MRRNPFVEALEKEHKKSMAQIVAEAYTREGTIQKAAASLGMKRETYYGWLRRSGVKLRKSAMVTLGGVA